MSKQSNTIQSETALENDGIVVPLLDQNHLPSEWQTVYLGSWLEENKILMKNGFAYGGYNQDGQGVPHLRPFNVTDDGFIDLSQVKYADSVAEKSPYWIKVGDVIFNNTNSEDLVGKTAYVTNTGRFVLSNHMTIIRVLDNEHLNAYWLAMKFQHLWRRGLFKAICRRHVGQASIGLDRLARIVISYPPPPQQRAIARVLQTVQDAIHARRKEIELERESKATLMQYLFTHGIRNELTQQSEIGEIPKSWVVTRLGNICLSSAFGPRFSSTHYSINGNIATLRTTDIDDDGNINYSTMPLSELNIKQFAAHLLEQGDLLVTRSGTCGIAAVFESFEKPVLPGAFLIRFRLSQQIDPYFLRYYMNSPVGKARVAQLANGAIQKNLTGTSLRNLSIPLPSLKEQKEILEVFNTSDSKIATLQKELALQEELFRALLDELMTGRLSALPLVEQ